MVGRGSAMGEWGESEAVRHDCTKVGRVMYLRRRHSSVEGRSVVDY